MPDSCTYKLTEAMLVGLYWLLHPEYAEENEENAAALASIVEALGYTPTRPDE